MRAKRSDECLFCTRRKCYTRIATNRGGYDEIACREHVRLLEQHADAHRPHVNRAHISSTAPLKRYGAVEWYEGVA